MELNKETLLALSQFKDYLFFEEPHEYYYNDKKVKTSVTKFVGTFFEEFDKEKISLAFANKNGVPQQQVLDDWQNNSDIASIVGTIVHKYAEDRQIGRVVPFDFSIAKEKNILEKVKERVLKLCAMYDIFAKDTHGRLIPIKTEFTVGIQDYIAGNIDLLVWNEKSQKLEIWDYKTSKQIRSKSDYKKFGFAEMEKYDDCELAHYSLQLNIYKEILKRFGIPIGDCYLVWLNEENSKYKVIPCWDLQAEARSALDKLCECK
ncbi:MAG: PD-(D/E)XK nuclease family protein [Clostridia bacterium]|jgi:ATP-dependent exoDNAse (exonuclease V) beta subunit|nr:PD-(D/E)XK nuclease family protein [Clostridia bacterium]